MIEYLVDKYRQLGWGKADWSPSADHVRRCLLLYFGKDILHGETEECQEALLRLILWRNGQWAAPTSWSSDEQARDRRWILPCGLASKWRHVHKDNLNCPVCADPVCDCGNPGWACSCSEGEEQAYFDDESSPP